MHNLLCDVIVIPFVYCLVTWTVPDSIVYCLTTITEDIKSLPTMPYTVVIHKCKHAPNEC